MKKLPSDIKQLVDKGNYVIALKELSTRDGISFDEAKTRIDAYEQRNQSNQTPLNQTRSNHQKDQFTKLDQNTKEALSEDFNGLVSSVKKDINTKKLYPIPLVWLRFLAVLLLVLLLSWVAMTVL